MLYLTPERFRTMGIGADLSNVEDWELRSILESASRMVDRYCNTPLMPQQFSFRGGTMTNEDHEWNHRRVFLTAKPIRAVLDMKLMLTNTNYLQVDPAHVFVSDSGWVEIYQSALTTPSVWTATYPGIGLMETISRTTYTYGYHFPVTGERLEPTDAQTWRALNQFWDEDEDITVYVNGTEKTTGLELDAEEGTVRITDNSVDFDDVVTLDYTHTLPHEIARGTALISASGLAEADLYSKGLGNLAEIQVEEVRLRRDARRSGTVISADAVPNPAAVLLDPFRFVTVML